MLLGAELAPVVEDALELLTLRHLLVEDRFRRRAQRLRMSVESTESCAPCPITRLIALAFLAS
jgi:hypothetical protein